MDEVVQVMIDFTIESVQVDDQCPIAPLPVSIIGSPTPAHKFLRFSAVSNRDAPFFTSFKYFSLLIQELQTKSFYYDEISRSLVKIILNLILRLFAQKDAENFKTNEFYLCARKFIDENFQSIESIEDICKSVYISRYYLTHLFKEYSGISPVQYIISKRMEKAKQLLSDTSLSVHEIAELTGYTEETSFLRTFKKTENMTPSEFRKKIKK